MKKLLLPLMALTLAVTASRAENYAWPEAYDGVMLQGFYWDSYDDTKWTVLESQADELSKYFSLIWVPNAARDKGNGGRSMGYRPVYWFSNYNTCFGTEAQLRSMIATYKAKGVGIIADVIINHREGVNSWMDFPAETWRGVTYQLDASHVCRNDEVNDAGNPGGATGANDTGDNFGGARDLDHTSPVVQEHCKAYTQFLLEEMGFAGFRYDMTLGYAGKYTKMYNEYSKPRFSVGEYWKGNYSDVKRWIDATGKQSAAFDFPGKYAINAAFTANDMTRLVWQSSKRGNQPAGMAYDGYGQYSVTFVDNHDTYRDGNCFKSNIPAANAFILCSPGTPCVFLPHLQKYPVTIKQLINVRKAVGVTNTSEVTVLRSAADCYLARVEGTNGELVVLIGTADVTPDGYSDADLRASGYGFRVWTKTPVEVVPGQDEPYVPSATTVEVFIRNTVGWSKVNAYAWNDAASDITGKWPGQTLTETRTINAEEWLYTSFKLDNVNLVLSTGTGSPQTVDITKLSGRVFLEILNTKTSGKYNVEKLKIVEDIANPGGYVNVHVVNSRGWERMYCHASNANEGELIGAFPGVEMTETRTIDGKVFHYTSFPAQFGANLVISNGEGKRTAVINQARGDVYYTISGASNSEGYHYVTSVQVSGVESVDADVDAYGPCQYFDLQGRLILTTDADEQPDLRPGIYIVRQGSKVTKQLVR